MSALQPTTGDTSNRLETLVCHSQSKALRILITGSKMEVPIQHSIVPWVDVCMRKLDTDRMHIICSIIALARSQPIPETYSGSVVRIHTTGTHTGYVRLVKEDGRTEVAELLWDECRVVGDGETIHGPAVLQRTAENRAELENQKYTLGNFKTNKTMYGRLPITDQDLVTAIHSPYWPVEAAEWITRSRVYGSPTRDVIKQVGSYGCDFVPVSHKFDETNEWRFSFSKAELLIIKSWRLAQNVIYGTLWLMKKKIDVSNICTYYLKTLMFWANEKKSLEFWSESTTRPNLDHSVRELLINLMAWLKSKYCPNYFIPANNMMDHLIDTDISSDITVLWRYLNNLTNWSDYSIESLLWVVMVGIFINKTDYELPAWVKRAIVIYDRINNEEDNFADLYQTKFEPNLLNVFRVELSDIFRSLVVQQMARPNKFDHPLCQQPDNYCQSEEYLKRAICLCESDERDTLENCDILTVRSIQNAYMECQCETISRTKRTEGRTNRTVRNFNPKRTEVRDRLKAQIKARSTVDRNCTSNVTTQKLFNFLEENENNQTTGRKIEIVQRKKCYRMSEIFNECPGVSPTVNISWFIAKAYFANLYYVTKRDVTSTLEICNDVIVAYSLSYMNERFAERAFPVILSTEMSCIYDKEIQELIGFYSLCSFVMNGACSRSVYLGVCPILFVLYVKLRVAETFTTKERKPILEEFFYHYTISCKCDVKVNSGRRILRLAWINHVRNQIIRSINFERSLQALFELMQMAYGNNI